MKLLIVSLNYKPELVGVGKFSAELAEWFAANGHKVRVICGPPHFPEWSVRAGYSPWRFSDQDVGGVHVFRVPVWIPRKPTGLARLVHLGSFGVSVLAACVAQMRWSPDVVLMMEPTLAAVPAGILLSRATGAAAWLHVQDLEIDAALKLGLLPSLLGSAASKLERALMKQCALITSISEAMLDKILAKGVAPDRTGLLSNWVDTLGIDSSSPALDLRPWLGCEPLAGLVLYSGSIGTKQGIDTLADALALLPPSMSVHTAVCSEGPMAEAFRKRCCDAGLSSVTFLPLQPAEVFVRMLTSPDVHVLLEESGAADLVMPSKLGGMLASGRPVVAVVSRCGSVARLLSEIQCGVRAEPGDAQGIADAILHVLANPRMADEMGRRGRAYAEEHLDRRVVLERAASLLEHVRRSERRRAGPRRVGARGKSA
ncbi:MAG: WcaI family glycosyltransferase [Actinomycetia bacterium]|nr:WcaI family glycosyltransferase [Actinomycetes bacterium]